MGTTTDPQMQWILVHVGLPEADDAAEPLEDLLSGQLPELGALGLEFKDEPRRIIATFREATGCEALLSRLRPQLHAWGLGALPLQAQVLHADDWTPYWDEAFEPLWFGGLCIVPSWAEPPPSAEHVLILDPNQAFGTGLHPTTALCLQRLRTLPSPPTLLDVGTGTGVLSLAMLMWGAGRAVGLDIDPIAVQAAEQAARTNGLAERFEVSDRSPGEIEWQFPLVVANLRPQPLLELAQDLVQRLGPGGRLLLSGMKLNEVEPVQAAYLQLGLRLSHRSEMEGWVGLEFEASA